MFDKRLFVLTSTGLLYACVLIILASQYMKIGSDKEMSIEVKDQSNNETTAARHGRGYIHEIKGHIPGSETHGHVVMPELTNHLPPEVVDLVHANIALCSQNSQLVYVIYVHSAPENFRRRDLIRTTWANSNLHQTRIIQVVFMLGLSAYDVINAKLASEIHQHNDIVQGNYIDHDQNLTLKAVMALSWLGQHCTNAAFAIKVDDETLLNIFDFIPYMDPHLLYRDRRVLICNQVDMRQFQRTPVIKRKRRLESGEVGQRSYPRFCAGFVFVLSRGLISELTRLTSVTNYFWLDNVYVTGLLAAKVRNLRVVSFDKTQTTPHAEHIQGVYLATVVESDSQFLQLWGHVLHSANFNKSDLNDTLMSSLRTKV